MKNKRFLLILLGYILTLFGLLVYSYAHIDLNLTLSSNSFYQSFQNQLIQLGYFKRGLSTQLFVVLTTLLFILQSIVVDAIRKKYIRTSHVLKLSIIAAGLLLFAYPAFSHDIFNYIFDTRLLIEHNVNPWQYTALDFPQDLWTRFMRWTHRTYPYGPTWLPLTVPFYLAGLGKFTPTLFWFKFLGVLSYLTSVWSVKNILKMTKPKYQTVGLALFALNPLIIIESLVTAHLDAVMAAVFLAGLVFLLNGRNVLSWIFLLLSAGMKYVTASAVPVWLWWKGKKNNFNQAVMTMLVFSLVATGVAIYLREILPWYFITPLALLSLLPERKELQAASSIISAGLLFRYTPFILIGEYTQQVNTMRNVGTGVAFLISIAVFVWIKNKSFSSPSL